jgi:hypothetical protein
MEFENHMHLFRHVVRGKCVVGHMLDMFAMVGFRKLLDSRVAVALVLSMEAKDDSFWMLCRVHSGHRELGLYCFDQGVEVEVEVEVAFISIR